MTQGPLWCISYSLEISGNDSWTYIHTHTGQCDPLILLCKASPAKKQLFCGENSYKIPFCVFNPSTVEAGFYVHPADTLKLCVPLILIYGCTYSVLGLAQDEICFPSGRCSGFGSWGSVVKRTVRFGKWGDISWPAVSSLLPTTMSCGKEEEAEPCPWWTGAGGTGGDINWRESGDHSFLLTWLQSLCSCTEELKNGDKLFRKG